MDKQEVEGKICEEGYQSYEEEKEFMILLKTTKT